MGEWLRTCNSHGWWSFSSIQTCPLDLTSSSCRICCSGGNLGVGAPRCSTFRPTAPPAASMSATPSDQVPLGVARLYSTSAEPPEEAPSATICPAECPTSPAYHGYPPQAGLLRRHPSCVKATHFPRRPKILCNQLSHPASIHSLVPTHRSNRKKIQTPSILVTGTNCNEPGGFWK